MFTPVSSDLVKNTKTESVFSNYFVTFLCSDFDKVIKGVKPQETGCLIIFLLPASPEKVKTKTK
jgi:hypothetical protein